MRSSPRAKQSPHLFLLELNAAQARAENDTRPLAQPALGGTLEARISPSLARCGLPRSRQGPAEPAGECHSRLGLGRHSVPRGTNVATASHGGTTAFIPTRFR